MTSFLKLSFVSFILFSAPLSHAQEAEQVPEVANDNDSVTIHTGIAGVSTRTTGYDNNNITGVPLIGLEVNHIESDVHALTIQSADIEFAPYAVDKDGNYSPIVNINSDNLFAGLIRDPQNTCGLLMGAGMHAHIFTNGGPNNTQSALGGIRANSAVGIACITNDTLFVADLETGYRLMAVNREDPDSPTRLNAALHSLDLTGRVTLRIAGRTLTNHPTPNLMAFTLEAGGAAYARGTTNPENVITDQRARARHFALTYSNRLTRRLGWSASMQSERVSADGFVARNFSITWGLNVGLDIAR